MLRDGFYVRVSFEGLDFIFIIVRVFGVRIRPLVCFTDAVIRVPSDVLTITFHILVQGKDKAVFIFVGQARICVF